MRIAQILVSKLRARWTWLAGSVRERETHRVSQILLEAAIGPRTLTRTRFGNWVQARGQNEQAARNLGVPVDRVTITL